MSYSRQQHEKWLRKNNCHPDQIKARKKKVSKARGTEVAKEYYANTSNGFVPGVLPVKSIWETIRTGNETPETIAGIREKAARVGPAFNKGGMQLLPKDQIIYSGKK